MQNIKQTVDIKTIYGRKIGTKLGFGECCLAHYDNVVGIFDKPVYRVYVKMASRIAGIY